MSYWKPGLVAAAVVVAVIAITLKQGQSDGTRDTASPVALEPQLGDRPEPTIESVEADEIPTALVANEPAAQSASPFIVYEDYRPYYANFRERRRVCNGVISAVNSNGENITLPNCWDELERSEFHDYSYEALITMVTEKQPYAIEALEVLSMRAFRAGDYDEGAQWVKLHAARSGKPGLLHDAQVGYLSQGTTEHQKIVYQFLEVLVESGYPGYDASMTDRQRKRLLSLGVSEAEINQLQNGSEEILSRMRHVSAGDGAASVSGGRLGGAA